MLAHTQSISKTMCMCGRAVFIITFTLFCLVTRWVWMTFDSEVWPWYLVNNYMAVKSLPSPPPSRHAPAIARMGILGFTLHWLIRCKNKQHDGCVEYAGIEAGASVHNSLHYSDSCLDLQWLTLENRRCFLNCTITIMHGLNCIHIFRCKTIQLQWHTNSLFILQSCVPI